MPRQLYTYREGKKVYLKKSPNQYVARIPAADIGAFSAGETERVSSVSSRVTVAPDRLEQEMAEARKKGATHHAYRIEAPDEDFLITDRVFVSFKKGTSDSQKNAVIEKYALSVTQSFSDDDLLAQLTNETGMNPVKLVVKLTEEEDSVALAEHDLNQQMIVTAFSPPNDPYYLVQWHLHTRLDHWQFDPRSSSRCEDAWRLLESFGDRKVVIGFTDDGCRLDHPDFNSPGKFAGWAYMEGVSLIDHTQETADREKMYTPGLDHGTNGAGIAAGETDATLTVGAAPGCRLFPVKWEGKNGKLFISDSKALKVLNYLSDKVDVLFNAWGLAPVHRYNALVTNKIKELAVNGGRRGKGIVFIWAAGNENCPINYESPIEIPYTNGWEVKNNEWKWVGVKTSGIFSNSLIGLPGVMFAGSITSLGQRSHYSNYGPGLDICAPSDNKHTYLRLGVYGLGVTAASGLHGNVVHTFGGTSNAAPLIAGIAALTISANPDLTATEVAGVLKRSAQKDLEMTGYKKTPPAPFDPDTSWDVSPVPPFDTGEFRDVGNPDGSWSPWFGHGKADAAEAVAMALRLKSANPAGNIVRISVDETDIPDGDPVGSISIIDIDEAGEALRLKLGFHIYHQNPGELTVSLTSPAGVPVYFHNLKGNAGNVIAEFDTDNTDQLAKFAGTQIKGKWILQVQDIARFDRGRLNSWYLNISRKTAVEPVLQQT